MLLFSQKTFSFQPDAISVPTEKVACDKALQAIRYVQFDTTGLAADVASATYIDYVKYTVHKEMLGMPHH